MFWQTLAETALSFCGTVIDDFFLLALLYSSCRNKKEKRNVTVGEFSGIAATFLLGTVGFFTGKFLPQSVLRGMGLVPILFAVIMLVRTFRGEEEEEKMPEKLGAGAVFLLILSCGADNIAVYFSVFSRWERWQIPVSFALFLLLTGLLCALALSLGSAPAIKRFAEKTKGFLLPAILFVLGLVLLFGR